jgi:hypothetical protein
MKVIEQCFARRDCWAADRVVRAAIVSGFSLFSPGFVFTHPVAAVQRYAWHPKKGINKPFKLHNG